MLVRFHPLWGWLFLLGGTLLTLGMILKKYEEEIFWFLLAPGLLLAINGILQLTTPYFWFDPTTRTVVVKAVVGGQWGREYGGTRGELLVVMNGRIGRVRPEGFHKFVPVSSWNARPSDWEAVLAHLANRPPYPDWPR